MMGQRETNSCGWNAPIRTWSIVGRRNRSADNPELRRRRRRLVRRPSRLLAEHRGCGLHGRPCGLIFLSMGTRERTQRELRGFSPEGQFHCPIVGSRAMAIAACASEMP